MKWHYAKNRKSFGPFSEEQMLEFFDDGTIGPKTNVWLEGTDDWIPFDKTGMVVTPGKSATPPPLPEAVVDPVPPSLPQPVASQQNSPTHNHSRQKSYNQKYGAAASAKKYFAYEGKGIARVTSILLWLALISSGFQGLMVLSADGAQAKFDAAVFTETNPEFLMLDGGVALLAAVFIFIWMYQRTSTIWANSGPQSITPAGAIYWFFVPIMWFFKPHEAMSNIVQKSNKSELQSSVNLWWGLFWGTITIAVASVFLGGDLENVRSLSDKSTYAIWIMIIHGVDVVGLFVLKYIIEEVSGVGWKKRQRPTR